MAPLLFSSATGNSLFKLFSFGTPLLILGLKHNAIAKLWVALYLVSAWSGSYLLEEELSSLWIFVLLLFMTSTLPLLAILVFSSPFQRWFLEPYLRSANRRSVDTGINDKNTYNPPEGEIELDIIAVNGLGAHPALTWRAEVRSQGVPSDNHSKKYVVWLRDLLPKSVPHARIMTFQHDSSYLVDATVKTIEECGEQLLREIERVRGEKERDRPILFIGHSFGGIVIKQALVLAATQAETSAHDIVRSTSGVIFLGTPHDGSWPSFIGKMVVDCTFWMASSSSIMDALGYRSTELRKLDGEFSDTYKSKITCFYEIRKTTLFRLPLSILVVDRRSATISGHRSVSLDTDHSGLNKFASADDPNYISIVKELKRMIGTDAMENNIRKCLDSLKPFGYEEMLSKISKPVPATCDWVKKQIDSFCSSPKASRVLVISGGPGIGKSVLARFIQEHLKAKESVQVNYFLFKDENKEGTTAKVAVSTLIYQLLDRNHGLFPHIKGFYKYNTERKKDWTFEQLWESFMGMMLDIQCKSTIILIDALDGCEEVSRRQLMKGFAARGCDFAGRFIVTTRPSDDLLDSFIGSDCIDLSSRQEVTDAIETLISVKVDEFFGSRNKFGLDIRQKVQDHLVQNADGMFLWVLLVMDRLRTLPSSSPGVLERELTRPPVALIPIYEDLFKQKLISYKESIEQKLPWILYARRPLKVEELQEALAIQDYKKYGKNWRIWLSYDLEGDLSRNFGPLVIIRQGSSEVRLLHQSLRGALLACDAPPTLLSSICKTAEEEHAEIAATCLDYLSLPEFSIEAPDNCYEWKKLLKAHPFLEYAAMNWPHHTESAGAQKTKILEHFQCLAALGLNMDLALQLYSTTTTAFQIPKGIPALQVAAFLGLGWLGIALVESGADVHERTTEQQSAMHRAAGSGAQDLIDMLLERGVQIDVRDCVGQTVLHYAAQRGCVRTVEFFLKKGLPVNESGRHGNTPLHYATWGGHPDVVRVLLAAGADPQKTNDKGYTSLEFSALYCRQDYSIIKQIFETHELAIS